MDAHTPAPFRPKVTPATVQTAAAAARAAAARRALDLCGSRLSDLTPVPLDELLDELVCFVVLDLLRGRLHQVRARLDERAGDTLVQRELREADGVDDDAGRVRRVPHLELELHVERHVAER